MNKLSEKNNRGVFLFIVVFSIICSFLNITSWTLFGVRSLLCGVLGIAAFIILSILMILQASNHCSHSTGRKLLRCFIIFYSIFNFLLFILVFLHYSPTLFLIIRIVFCIILIICFHTNKLDSTFFKVTNTVFFILALFILIFSYPTCYPLCYLSSYPIIENLLVGIWEFIPIFLYLNFYDRINDAMSNSKIKNKSPEAQLKELKEKFDSGVITLDEYNIAKQNILHKFITR